MQDDVIGQSRPQMLPSSPVLDKAIGQLVNYYLDGQRTGWLECIKNGSAVIRPIAPYKAGKQRCVTVPAKYVDVVEVKAAPVKPRG